jgi:hypothetical protein
MSVKPREQTLVKRARDLVMTGKTPVVIHRYADLVHCRTPVRWDSLPYLAPWPLPGRTLAATMLADSAFVARVVSIVAVLVRRLGESEADRACDTTGVA